jgi:hypothetical protein
LQAIRKGFLNRVVWERRVFIGQRTRESRGTNITPIQQRKLLTKFYLFIEKLQKEKERKRKRERERERERPAIEIIELVHRVYLRR